MNIGLKSVLRILMFITILFPSVAILVTGLISMFGFSLNMMKEETETLIYSQTGGLELILDDIISEIKIISRFEPVRETAQWKYSNVKDEIIELMENIKRNNKYIIDIVITDHEGIVCADFKGRNAGSIYSNFNTDVRGISQNETYLSDITVRNDEYDGINTFYLVHQIYNGDDSVGYISIVVNTGCFNEYLEKTSFFNNGSMFIIDGKGTALNFNDEPVMRLEEINSGLKDLISEVSGSRKNTALNYNVLEKDGYIGSYGNISATDWMWFGVYPKSVINSLIVSDYFTGLVIVSVITVVFMVIMIVISHKMTVPLSSMIKQLKKSSSGKHTEQVNIFDSGEFGKISAAFNKISGEFLISEELHRTASELSDNMLFEWNFRKKKLYVSDNFNVLFNIDTDDCNLSQGNFIDALIIPEHKEEYKRDIAKLLKSNEPLSNEYQMYTKSGSCIWVSVRAQCVTDRLENLIRITGVITNIDSEKKLTLRLSERASYDFLSHLYNRSTFERELQRELERSASSRVGVIFIDLDDFKYINDYYGHSAGDEIIKHISEIIKKLIKNEGFAGRFGGDEFIMCVTGKKYLNNIEKLATEFLQELSKGYFSEASGEHFLLKASLGISLSPQHGKNGIILIAAADEAMYFVKKNGKCNYCVYNPDKSNLTNIMRDV